MEKLLRWTFLLWAALIPFCASAEDAASYFDNAPFGWATCSDATGTAYKLDGGQRTPYPASTVLYHAGDNDGDAILSAVKRYDVVVLDGSKGDFIISATMDMKDVQNKTILGRNNARLCTKWYITPAYKKALQDAKLDQYSSGQGSGGTLPNGETIGEDREYYTRLTLINATGDESESYRKSGIIKLRGTAENIIIRNLTLVGPGSVDVGGDDLLGNNGASHVWVDHCAFIDGMDGNLDSGHNTADMFVTYSWCTFGYTDRSYSHAYSNGTGWGAGYVQYVTYANCIWGAGCERRLPQVGDCWLHLLNCYYDCAGNSAALIIGANSTVLAEGNNAANGVKSPVTVSTTSGVSYVMSDNIGFAAYRNATLNAAGGLKVPYDYVLVSGAQTPELLQAAHGAGPTLSEDMLLAEPIASNALVQPRKWDFSSWSDATIAQLKADTEHWTANGSNYTINFTTTAYTPLEADGKTIAETEGLLFRLPKSSSSGTLVLYTEAGKGSMRLNRVDAEVYLQQLQKGDQLKVVMRSANSSEERGLNATNTSPERVVGANKNYEATFTVVADGPVSLTPTGGIYVVSIELTRLSADTLQGDANGDGQVDLADIVTVINAIAAGDTANAKLDANGDKTVDLSDISFIIDIISDKQ